MVLEATWGRVMRVWWSFVWRHVLATIGAMVVGVIVGFILGLIFGILGTPPQILQAICVPVGVLIGLVFSIIPIWPILNKDFGEFRLVLLSKHSPAQAQPEVGKSFYPAGVNVPEQYPPV